MWTSSAESKPIKLNANFQTKVDFYFVFNLRVQLQLLQKERLITLNGSVCIRDLDKLNFAMVIWSSISKTAQSQNMFHALKYGQNWVKNKHYKGSV